jgi:hypothetical protein
MRSGQALAQQLRHRDHGADAAFLQLDLDLVQRPLGRAAGDRALVERHLQPAMVVVDQPGRALHLRSHHRHQLAINGGLEQVGERRPRGRLRLGVQLRDGGFPLVAVEQACAWRRRLDRLDKAVAHAPHAQHVTGAAQLVLARVEIDGQLALPPGLGPGQ